jgi:hypothetical protein
MRDAIIEKLNKHFAAAPETEAGVAYAFVQIRKLLEKDGQKKHYPRLTFFCDWVVHGKLTGRETGQVLLEMDARLQRYDPAKPEALDPDGQVHALLSHRSLQQEMLRYLTVTGINDVWVRDPAWWHRLSGLYTEIVRDSPLETGRANYKFKYLAKLEITASGPFAPIVEANPGQHHIGWIWTFTLNDGRSFEMHHTSSFGDGRGSEASPA